MTSFSIRRELVTVQEDLTDLKEGFAAFVNGDETEEVEKFKNVIKEVKELRSMLEEFFED